MKSADFVLNFVFNATYFHYLDVNCAVMTVFSVKITQFILTGLVSVLMGFIKMKGLKSALSAIRTARLALMDFIILVVAVRGSWMEGSALIDVLWDMRRRWGAARLRVGMGKFLRLFLIIFLMAMRMIVQGFIFMRLRWMAWIYQLQNQYTNGDSTSTG